MKFRSIIMAAGLFSSAAALAQSPQLSLGVDLGIPQGDFADVASLTVGPAAGFEYPLSDNLGLVAQLAYHFVMLKDEVSESIDSYSLLPAQAGLKYYFTDPQEGVYGQALVGIHSASVKTKDIDLGPFGTIEGETNSESNLSFGFGAGFQAEKFDAGVRYQIITAGDEEGAESTSYIGIRIAYLIPLGG